MSLQFLHLPSSRETMRVTMKQRYPIRTQYLDTGNPNNFTNPYSPSPPGVAGPPRHNAFSPAVVAVIGVLAGAFLIVSYYRIFAKYCNRYHFPFWGTRSDGRNGGPSTIVLMEEHGAWPPNALGLDDALISRIPTCKYDPHEGLVDGTECLVCLGEFELGEVLRILPKCNHPFHIPCIDTWLVTSSTCPLCRVNIVLAATIPYALMPLEREPPAHSLGPTMSLIPAGNPNPMQALINHEIEILQEQHVQEFFESGQLSGPSSSISVPSSRGSFMSAPDVGTPENHRIDSMEASTSQLHSRHLSLDTGATPAREIHLVNNQNFTLERNPQISRQLSVSTKRRLYSRARKERHWHLSEGGPARSRGERYHNYKGKHPLVPFSSPQTKRFARAMGTSSSTCSTGSSSNQVVVELLAQEIFQTHCSSHSQTSSKSILESVRKVRRMRSSIEASTTGAHGHGDSFRRSPRIRHDNASFELMWSINEQENPLIDCIESNKAIGHNTDDSSVEEETAWMSSNALQLACAPSSDDDEDGQHSGDVSRPNKSFTRDPMQFNADPCQVWHSKPGAFKNSMARLKRYGSMQGIRQNSFRKVEKVHASEPVFEIFDF